MRIKITALILCFFSLVSSVFAEQGLGKPTTPVQISIVPETAVTAGAVCKFIITASSQLASDNFVITIIPPAGGVLLSGSQQWQGPVLPQHPVQLQVTIRMPATGESSITADATIQASDGSRLAASTEYRLSTASTMGAVKARAGRVVPRQGSPVVEFAVK